MFLVSSRPIYSLEEYSDDQLFYLLSSDTIYTQSFSIDETVLIDRVSTRTQYDGTTSFDIDLSISNDSIGEVVYEQTISSNVLSDDPLNPWFTIFLNDLRLKPGTYTMTLVGHDDSYLNVLYLGHQFSYVVNTSVLINGKNHELHLNIKVMGYH